MTDLEIVRVAALTDNYIWLIHDPVSDETVVVDPGEAAPALAEATRRGWTIGQVWNTHWHADHTGGNAEVKAATDAIFSGPAAEAAKIPTLDVKLAEGDTVRIGSHVAQVIAAPGHTAGHILFHLAGDAVLLAGDTLFAMGCGRLFEGTPEQMFANMQHLATLPDETQVFCAHEYTQSNGRYALVAEPDNSDIVARMRDVDALRAAGEATVPTTIALERATNPFLRAADVQQFARRRAEKDSFRG
ncbi:hydroxyacylglutathione hydrolase [Sphingomonas sp. BAUL-RG-20F-R05-02]|uniref:hydroxyacylglutathione hydrolase n=1 Tax=Sphingomonas sp. BAUL-RG-20F-R05-02 TaxID=2914830 RepID=UPI001F566484|nr:hydroxyacylglutathione hydrolase [Sphingomonas sp. BAUL-RG-20F-R05-02]